MVPQLAFVRGRTPLGTRLVRPRPLTSSAVPAGPGKLGGEAVHLAHLRPLPESQPSASPLHQTAPGVKAHQRVVTLAQHISVTTPSLPLPPHLCAWGGGRGEGKVTQLLGLVGKLSSGGEDRAPGVGEGSSIRDPRVSNPDSVAAPRPTLGDSV